MSRLLPKYGVLILGAILYFPFIFFGYGTDNDTFAVLDNGKHFIKTGIYIPSRHPGYIVHEAATMLLSSVGGSILSNAATMIMSLLFIACFLKVCHYFSLPNSNYLTILLIVHPLILINSTETIDYLWALGLLFSGFMLLLNCHYFFTGILLGLAIGARLSSFIAVGGILAYALFFRKEHDKVKDRKKVFLAIFTTVVVGVLCYIPPLIYSNWTLDFLKPHIPDNEAWSFKSRIGKFVYKNIYFWGLPAFAVIAYIMNLFIRNRTQFFKKQWATLSLLSIAVIVGYEMLFLQFPVQNEYLLPMLPFCLFLIGIGLKNNPRIIVALILSVASLNIVNINIAKADVPRQATDATFGLWIEKGLLIREMESRSFFRNCTTGDCWQQVFKAEIEN